MLNPQRQEVMNPASHAYSHSILGAMEEARKALDDAPERIVRYADQKITDSTAYKIGDAVML